MNTRMTVVRQGPSAQVIGLTSAEAAAKLRQYGPNEIESGKRFRLVREGLGLLANPLVLILLAASAISGFVGQALEAGIIVLVVLLCIALDFLQVFRSEQAANQLKTLVTPTSTVWRRRGSCAARIGRVPSCHANDGRPVDIPVREVVPGDLLELRAGDLVSADCTLLTGGVVSVDEAALTGESLPTSKHEHS